MDQKFYKLGFELAVKFALQQTDIIERGVRELQRNKKPHGKTELNTTPTGNVMGNPTDIRGA